MGLRRRQFEGPLYAWGDVPGTTRPEWYPWRGRSYSPRLRRRRAVEETTRGEWQWRGRAPDAWSDYGWEMRGGDERGENVFWPEMSPAPRSGGGRYLAEQRGGGIPREQHRWGADSWYESLRLKPPRRPRRWR